MISVFLTVVILWDQIKLEFYFSVLREKAKSVWFGNVNESAHFQVTMFWFIFNNLIFWFHSLILFGQSLIFVFPGSWRWFIVVSKDWQYYYYSFYKIILWSTLLKEFYKKLLYRECTLLSFVNFNFLPYSLQIFMFLRSKVF